MEIGKRKQKGRKVERLVGGTVGRKEERRERRKKTNGTGRGRERTEKGKETSFKHHIVNLDTHNKEHRIQRK